MIKRRTMRVLIVVAVVIAIPILVICVPSCIRRFISPVSVGGSGSEAEAFDGRLRLATFNIAHGRGGVLGASNWDGGSKQVRRQRLEEIGHLLDESGADVVCLNEVDFRASWSHGVDQVQVLADAGAYPFVVRQTNIDISFPFFHLQFGNAVLSKYPIEAAWIERLPSHSQVERLVAGSHDSVVVRIRLAEDQTILVWAVHLESRSAGARHAAAHRIVSRAAEFAEPLFIVGDFNSSPNGFPRFPGPEKSALDIIMDTGEFATFPSTDVAESIGTFPSETPSRTIDWLLSPKGVLPVDGAVLTCPLSDHLPVFATYAIDLPPN